MFSFPSYEALTLVTCLIMRQNSPPPTLSFEHSSFVYSLNEALKQTDSKSIQMSLILPDLPPFFNDLNSVWRVSSKELF